MGRPSKSETGKGTRLLERQLERFQEQLLYHEGQVAVTKQRIATVLTAIKDLNAIEAPENGSSMVSISTTVGISCVESEGVAHGESNAL